MNFKFYAVMLSTALVTNCSFAQDLPSKSFGMTIGPQVFALPNIDTGVAHSGAGNFSPMVSGTGLGSSFGFSGGFSAGEIKGVDVSIGVSGFASFGHAENTVIDRFTGAGTLSIAGYTTPGNASIDLVTNSTPGNSAASAAINHVNPQGGGEVITVDNPLNGGGSVNNYGATVAGGNASFGLAGVATQQGAVNGAAAFGAVGASDGGVFLASGDLTGLAVATDVTRNILFTGADLSVAFSGNEGSLSFQGYVGPSYRLLDQRITTTTTVDVAEAGAGATTFPLYSMARDEHLVSHYVGGLAGVTVSNPLSDGVTFSLGLEGGLYYVHDSLTGRESYSMGGGSPTLVPVTTVTNTNGLDLSADGVAWSAKVSPSVTYAIAPNRQITLGAAVDYLSRVPTVTRDGTVATVTTTYGGTDDGALNYSGQSQTSNRLSYAAMWSFTPTVSLTGQF